MTTLIRNATILTMNDRLDIVEGAVTVERRTHRVGRRGAGVTRSTTCVNAGGDYLLPGFIQTHVHLCQTLFRSYADDMPLLEWLRRRIWPMEAAHSPATLRAADAPGRGRAAALGHDHGPDDGDRARHRRRLRGAGRDRTARDGRQVHDGFGRQRAGAAARDRRSSRSTRASRCANDGKARRADGCARPSRRALPSPALASCSRRSPRSRRASACIVHTHASESRDEVDGRAPALGRTVEPRVPRGDRPRERTVVRRSLRLGQRDRAGAPRRARRQGHALPRLQPQARLGNRSGRRDAATRHLRSRSAPTAPPATIASTCSTRCGSRPRFRLSGMRPVR